MAVAQIAITIEQAPLVHLDRLVLEKIPKPQRAIQDAKEEKISRLEKNRLREECAKSDPAKENRFAEEGFASEKETWPEYRGAKSAGRTRIRRSGMSSPERDPC